MILRPISICNILPSAASCGFGNNPFPRATAFRGFLAQVQTAPNPRCRRLDPSTDFQAMVRFGSSVTGFGVPFDLSAGRTFRDPVGSALAGVAHRLQVGHERRKIFEIMPEPIRFLGRPVDDDGADDLRGVVAIAGPSRFERPSLNCWAQYISAAVMPTTDASEIAVLVLSLPLPRADTSENKSTASPPTRAQSQLAGRG